MAQNDVDTAVENYLAAVRHDPDNVRYRVSLYQALFNASSSHLRRGDAFREKGELKPALLEYQKALEFNSENNDARNKKRSILKELERRQKQLREKTEIERIKEAAVDSAAPQNDLITPDTPLDLKLGEIDLKVLFKALQKSSSIKFLFDEAFQSGKVSVDLENVQFQEALDKILMQTKMFYKIVDEKTVIVIPDTPAKRRQYDELSMRTFFLSNADPEEMQKMIHSLAGCKVMSVNKSLNTITVRDVPEKIAMVGQLLKIMDKPKAELLIDIEIIEVNKSRLKQYGIELSDYNVMEAFSPGTYSSDAETIIRGNRFSRIDSSDFVFKVPSFIYKLMQNDSQTKIKAKPQLRVVDKETVKIRLGDKVPIVTTTFVPSMGTAVNNQPITSYQMQDVGINIELVPHIHHDGWISMKLEFELTFITSQGSTALPPTIGNRSVETLIRLQDNETSMLAGLLRDTETNSRKGLPVLSDLPVLKHILSSNSREVDQTDIILTITPRIIKFPEISGPDLSNYWVGTEERVGLRSDPPRLELKEPPVESFEKARPEAGKTPPENEKSPAGEKSSNTAETIPAEKPGEVILIPESNPVEKGKSVNLKVMIRGADSLRAMELDLKFDPGVLRLDDARQGAFFQSERTRGHFFKSFDNAAGTAKISMTFSESDPLDPKEMVRLRFSAINMGKGLIRIESIRAFSPDMRNIPMDVNDLTIQVTEKK